MDDQYGLCGGYNMNGMLIMTSGYHFTESAADSSRTLAGCTERLIDFNRMLYETYQQPWYFNCYPYKGDNRFADASVRFTEDKYLFFLQDVSYAQKFSGAMDSYGILPIPKFDAEQKECLSYGRPMVTGIAADAKDPVMAAAVLESLHCESKKTMMPAYYDIALSSRYASTPEAAKMLDLILPMFRSILRRSGIPPSDFRWRCIIPAAVWRIMRRGMRESPTSSTPIWKSCSPPSGTSGTHSKVGGICK